MTQSGVVPLLHKLLVPVIVIVKPSKCGVSSQKHEKGAVVTNSTRHD